MPSSSTGGGAVLALDLDFEVYEGALAAFYSHGSTLCSTGGLTTATRTPQAGDDCYLVVPRNTVAEGSYGRSSAGAERPPGSLACVLQQIAACP